MFAKDIEAAMDDGKDDSYADRIHWSIRNGMALSLSISSKYTVECRFLLQGKWESSHGNSVLFAIHLSQLCCSGDKMTALMAFRAEITRP